MAEAYSRRILFVQPTSTVSSPEALFLLVHTFVPRPRDLADQQLYRIDEEALRGNLHSLFRSGLDLALLVEQWDQLVRVASA